MPTLQRPAPGGIAGAAANIHLLPAAPAEAADIGIAAENYAAAHPVSWGIDAIRPHGQGAASRSRYLEPLAAKAMLVSPRRLDLLGILLAATVPGAAGRHGVLQPLWVHEAVQRAFALTRLVAALDDISPGAKPAEGFAKRELLTATRLAAHYHALAKLSGNDKILTPCSVALRGLVHDLVELFGPAVGTVSLAISVDHIMLPAFQCRALILAAGELVFNALLHAFTGRTDGRITVCLVASRDGMARLSVDDDGSWKPAQPHDPGHGHGIARDLADLLLAQLGYRIDVTGTRAEIRFPLHDRKMASCRAVPAF